MGNKVTLIVAFSAVLVLFFGMTLFDDAQAMKSKGNSLTEVSSKQVCGNFLCDEPLSIAEKIAIYLLTLAQQEEETEILQQSMSLSQQQNTGIRVQIGEAHARQTPNTDFGTMMKEGLKSLDVKQFTPRDIKASKLAVKLINKYDLKEEKLSPYLQKARVEGGTLLEKDQLRSLGDKGNKVTGTDQQAIQQLEEQLASLTGLPVDEFLRLFNILNTQDPNNLCRLTPEIFILLNEIEVLKNKLDSLQGDRHEFKDNLRHYDSSNPGHQPLINQLLNLIENTNKQMQKIEDKISQKEFRLNQLDYVPCEYEMDPNYVPDDYKEALAEAKNLMLQIKIEEAERNRQAAEEAIEEAEQTQNWGK